VLKLEQVDEAAIGALMMHYMCETIIAADMLGIDAFNQPAVEQGKILAREYMTQIPKRG
jgi:glucose-6-phosphate isomerase